MEPTAAWVFVFKLLGPLWLGPPQGMDPRTKATLGEADEVLAGLWRAAQAMTQGDPSAAQPRAARIRVDGRYALAIVMPRPQSSPEPWFALSAEVGGRWRCLTFERPPEGVDGAVLAEVTRDRHVNYGVRPGPPTLPGFLAACAEVLSVPIEHVEGPFARFTPGVTKTPDWVWLVVGVVIVGIFVALTFLI